MDKLPDYNWKPGDTLKSLGLNTIVSKVNEIDAGKQDPIIDLNIIRRNANLCKDKVQPSDIVDMQTKTDATKVYATKTALSALVKTKQDVIDTGTLYRNSSMCVSAVQPSDIVDMQTKTDADNNYTLLTDYNTQRGIANNLLNPTLTTDINDIEYLQGYNSAGELVQISIDDYEKSKDPTNRAWGVIINPNNSSPELETVGDYTYWESFKENIGRYLMVNSGKAIKLSKTDSSIAIDGTYIDETIGHVMVRIPQLYYNVVSNEDGSYTLWMSEHDLGGHLIPEIWAGAYPAYMFSSDSVYRITSRSGVNPTKQLPIDVFFADAQANSPDFGLVDYNYRRVIKMLSISEFHSLNDQSTLGPGMTKGGWNTYSEKEALTGETCSHGDMTGNWDIVGSDSKTYNHISLFGIEDPYGWYHEFAQGIYFGSANNAEQDGTEVFIYEGNRLPTSDELTTHPNGNYRQLTRPTSNSNGWIKSIVAGPYFDLLPSAVGGSSSTYWCNYLQTNNNGQVSLWGGLAYYGSYCGIGFLNTSNAWSHMNGACSSRLAYYGSPTIVQKYEELTA